MGPPSTTVAVHFVDDSRPFPVRVLVPSRKQHEDSQSGNEDDSAVVDSRGSYDTDSR